MSSKDKDIEFSDDLAKGKSARPQDGERRGEKAVVGREAYKARARLAGSALAD